MQLRYSLITGPDALAFLQSQLCGDVETFEQSTFYPTAWCQPNGRVFCTLLIARHEGGAIIVMPESMAADLAARINLYRIGRKLQATEPGRVGERGPSDGNLLPALTLAYDRRRDLAVSDARSSMNAQPIEPCSRDWLMADLERRMPWILPETHDRFLPQMLGLEELGGLSYGKGCYPGQEVIARVHYRGRVTRRIRPFRLNSKRRPEPGAEVKLDDQSGTVLYGLEGETQNATCGLAVMPADCIEGAPICVHGAPGLILGPSDPTATRSNAADASIKET
ncbi:MAG: hypothetical protein LC637_04230 [Xanthomonadaceae bacterium]|nr:hypothetical protein [Xanthomonadaceae bacterium]